MLLPIARIELTGPNGLRLVLDSAEIFPADPGQGTPAMVYLGRHSATFWCALNEGELDCGERQLSATQCAWLEAQESTVGEFLDAHTPTN